MDGEPKNCKKKILLGLIFRCISVYTHFPHVCKQYVPYFSSSRGKCLCLQTISRTELCQHVTFDPGRCCVDVVQLAIGVKLHLLSFLSPTIRSLISETKLWIADHSRVLLNETIISKDTSSIPDCSEVYSIQPYIIKFDCDLRQPLGFLHRDVTEISLAADFKHP